MNANNSPQAQLAHSHKVKADVLQQMCGASGSVVLAAGNKLFRVDPDDPHYQQVKQLIEEMAVHHITVKHTIYTQGAISAAG